MEALLEKIKRLPKQTEESLTDALGIVSQFTERADIKRWCKWIRSEAKKIPTIEMYELSYETYLLEAQRGDFDSYCIYLEKPRDPERRFYLPRRSVLLPLVNDL